MPNDRDFGAVERKKAKKRPIFSYDQYVDTVVKKARINPSPFAVKKMASSDFKNFDCSSTNFTKPSLQVDSNGEHFNWLDIREFVFEKGTFGFRFRCDIRENEPLRFCDFGKTSNRSKRAETPEFYAPQYLHPNGVPLKEQKYQDIMSLLFDVPSHFHSFYKNLPHGSNEHDLENNDIEIVY